MKNKIIDYIVNQYEPHTIILYGSYADGSNNTNSDFDALVITDKQCVSHDGNEVDGVLLDIFIYNTSHFNNEIDYEKYVQIHDGNIVLDRRELGKKLQDNICRYIKNLTNKSDEEKQYAVEWCEKMLLRAGRDDIEGCFRWHWLLVDSLEIYFNLCNTYYYGPKKSLTKMKQQDPEAYRCYNKALTEFSYESLRKWISYLRYILTQSKNRL